MTKAVAELSSTTDSSPQDEDGEDTPSPRSKKILVLGMGASAFGRERRAVRALSQMKNVIPYFLISKYEDGSVARLLSQYAFQHWHVPFGYLGRAKLVWTAITVIQLPTLFLRILRSYYQGHCTSILVLCMHPLLNALPVLAFLRFISGADVILYLGDAPAQNRVYRLLARAINRLSDRIVTNSEFLKREFVKLGVREKSIRVIYNGVDAESFARAPQMDFRERYQWPDDTIIVGYVGQFTENKGASDFVEAAKRAAQADQRLRFVMIGDYNSFQESVAEEVRERGLDGAVRFAGRVDGIESAYAGLDLLVVPSRHDDPAPNVNLEAMASGLPVIGTRTGGTPELLVHGQTGFLVEKENPQEITERILQLADDEDLRKKMGAAGATHVRTYFDIATNARLVESIILSG